MLAMMYDLEALMMTTKNVMLERGRYEGIYGCYFVSRRPSRTLALRLGTPVISMADCCSTLLYSSATTEI